MTQIISIEYLGKEIQLLEKLTEKRISGIYIYSQEKVELQNNTLTSENIIIQTESCEFNFFSQGLGQHYYGEYDIEITKELDKEFIRECEINEVNKISLLSSGNWKNLENKKITQIKIFSTGRKVFNLLKLRNEKPYEQAHYIEFTNENGEIFSIGYYGNDNKGENNFLNNYSWTGELKINLNNGITESEIKKWDLKEIYKNCW